VEQSSSFATMPMVYNLTRPTRLSKIQRDQLLTEGYKLLRVSGFRAEGDYYVLDTRVSGDDFCCQCGRVASRIQFLKAGRCPNEECPRPEFWDD